MVQPTDAYAEVVDLVDGYVQMSWYCLGIDTPPTANDLTGSTAIDVLKTTIGKQEGEIDLTNTGYMASSQGGAISLAGTVNQSNGSSSLTGMYTDTSHNISVDTAGYIESNLTYNELYRTSLFTLGTVPDRSYMSIVLRTENLFKAGDKIKLVTPGMFTWEYEFGNGTRTINSGFRSVQVWASNTTVSGNATKLIKDEYGYYEIEDSSTAFIFIVFQPRSTALTSAILSRQNCRFLFYNPFKLLMYVTNRDIENLSNQTIMNTTQINNKITQQTQQQTSELKDTTGSDSVISGTDGVSQQIQSKLGFIAETATITSNLYDAILYEGDGYVPFPEIAWEGQTIISAQNVPILGYIPSIEDDIKTFNTIVLFLAWLHGMHSLYARIFLGQVEVINEDD